MPNYTETTVPGLQLMGAVQSWTLKQMLKRDAALAPAPEPELEPELEPEPKEGGA